MSPTDRFDDALGWARRLHEPAFADWDAHLAWLEESPENAAALDRALLAIEDAAERLAVPARHVEPAAVATGANRPNRTRRFAFAAGLALAAGLGGGVGVRMLFRSEPRLIIAETAAAERRTIRLPDGSLASLNGDTRLVVDRLGRSAQLARGEVFLSVKHDPEHPFSISAGGEQFQDVGTAFDIIRAPGRIEVAVREGAVMVDPSGQRLLVSRGQALRFAGANVATRRMLDPASVGGWRGGRLTFADAPMADVASDLGRALGRPVTVEGEAAARRFSGVIVIDRDQEVTTRRAAAVTGLTVTRSGGGWRLTLPHR